MARRHKRSASSKHNKKTTTSGEEEEKKTDVAVEQTNTIVESKKKRAREEDSTSEKVSKKPKKEEKKQKVAEDKQTSSATTASDGELKKVVAPANDFSWSAFNSIIDKEAPDQDFADSDDDSEEEDQDETAKNMSSTNAQQKRLNERLVAEREKELVSEEVLPETDADFERLLVGSPNNSYIWIQYMAFKLANTDIDAARKIGERALKKISFREEQEKFNMFAALMNLESKFGDDDSQRKLFNRAVQYCEAKDVYLQQAKIYEQNGDHDKVASTYQKMMKKFFQSRKPYEAYQQYLLCNGKQYKKANEVLERGLKNLPKKKHLKAISKFALLHYRYGSIIDGNQIFEQLVANYPKRTDIWSLYINAELSAKRFDQVRNIYERVVTINLSTKKMQSYLKRYLKFEKLHGTEEGQTHVKDLAREYIARKTGSN